MIIENLIDWSLLGACANQHITDFTAGVDGHG